MLAVLDAVHDGLQLAFDAVTMAPAEGPPDLFTGHPPQA